MPRQRLIQIALLPTLLTLGNLACGVWSINYTMRGQLEMAGWFIFLAMLFDALDGKVARATRSATRFGAQLDSLADLASFGVAPALLARWLARQSGHEIIPSYLFMLLCIFYVICSALRLARFNIETTFERETHNYFTGLPTPGAAGLLASCIILYYHLGREYSWFPIELIWVILPILILTLAILMVSQYRYIHLLNRLTQTRHPFARLVEIILALLLFAYKTELVLWLAFLVYVFGAPILDIYTRIFRKPRPIALLSGKDMIIKPRTKQTADEEVSNKNHSPA